MFKIEFYDDLTRQLVSPWWMYLLLGINFLVLGILIFLFPKFLVLIISTFLIACGLLFFGIAFSVWRIRRKYNGWKNKHSIPVQ